MIKKVVFITLICLLGASCNLNRNNFRLNGRAMLPTIPEGSLVKITKEVDKLEYGDLIVFYPGQNQKEYLEDSNPIVFRIVALPLDILEVRDELCIVNGREEVINLIQETGFLNIYETKFPNGQKAQIHSIVQEFKEDEKFNKKGMVNQTPIRIPADHYFVMGDYRSDAVDSRQIGSIPRSRIIGKVIEITPP